MNEINRYRVLETMIKELHVNLLKILKFLSDKNNPSKAKGYNLVKVKNKKHGFLFYVRYIENGKLVYSRWNTNTNDEEAAKLFAVENRERILEEYFRKKQVVNYDIDIYKLLKDFYSKNSKYILLNEKLNRPIQEKDRVYYNNIVNKIFIPFLRDHRIKKFSELSTSLIGKFQLYLIDKGKNPQSIIRYLKTIKRMFVYFSMMGIIEKNIFENFIMIKINKSFEIFNKNKTTNGT